MPGIKKKHIVRLSPEERDELGYPLKLEQKIRGSLCKRKSNRVGELGHA
jgi:hypothetical protein